MNEKKSNKKIMFVVVFSLLLLIGGTLAAVNFRIFNGNYAYKTTCFDIIYDTGEDITGTMFPSKNDQGGLGGAVSIGIDQSCGVEAKANLYLNIDDNTSNKFIEVVTPHCENKNTLETLTEYTTSDTCVASENGIWVDNGTALKYSLYNSDNLEDAITVGYVNRIGESINIYKDFILKESTSYTVYIWLDGELADNSYSGLNFSANISATAEQIFKYIEEPVLDDGMIPVTISDSGIVTTISEDDSNWYDYENKKWANMVLVNENATDSVDGSKSREYYLNNPGTIVIESDILAYYVWIPRYKYKIWTTSASSTGSEQTIDIQFELKNDDFSLGTNVGEYRTHPAFWWDDNNDGVMQAAEKLSGIWVGKFETGGDATIPLIKPNIQALTNQSVSTQFQTSLKFAGGVLDDGNVVFDGSNIYGLTNNTDSHMMKNSEWGSVAYLSHSQYGINEEVRINNNSDYITGCGASSIDANLSSVCEIAYKISSNEKNSYPQSTTGNISGIFDMSGGSYEYTMAVLADSDGKPMSGSSSSANSGFNGTFDSGSLTNGLNFPEEKYYNLYNSTVTTTACDGGVCYGHALSETSLWYSDSADFFSTRTWVGRGGYNEINSLSGIFYFHDGHGKYCDFCSFRSVLIPFIEYATVMFNTNGGDVVDSIKVIYKNNYGELPIPEKYGYEFLGWYTEIDGGELITEDSVVNVEDSITLYAHWE